VAGVVQDMLAAHREDNDRRQADNDSRQQVQLQMMLAHREETELRLPGARESADKQMRLLQEMHESAMYRFYHILQVLALASQGALPAGRRSPIQVAYYVE